MLIEQNLEETVENCGRTVIRYGPETHPMNLRIARYIINKSMYNVGISRYVKKIINSKKDLAKVLKMKKPVLPEIHEIGYAIHNMIKDFFKEEYRKDVKLPYGVKSPMPTMSNYVSHKSGGSHRGSIRKLSY